MFNTSFVNFLFLELEDCCTSDEDENDELVEENEFGSDEESTENETDVVDPINKKKRIIDLVESDDESIAHKTETVPTETIEDIVQSQPSSTSIVSQPAQSLFRSEMIEKIEPGSDEESAESEPEIVVDPSKKKRRIIDYVDSDDEAIIHKSEIVPTKIIEDVQSQPSNSIINSQPSQSFFHSESECLFDFTEPSISEKGNADNMKVLFDTQSPNIDLNKSVDDELLDICSGQFSLTQSHGDTVFAKNLFTPEIGGPFTQTLNQEANNELLDLCSGPFTTQLNSKVCFQPTIKVNVFIG